MRSYFPSTIRPRSGGLLAGLLLVCWLGPHTAQAQTPAVPGVQIQPAPSPTAPGLHIILDGPQSKGPLPVIYLDGQRRDSTQLASLNPDDIATVEILKSPIGRLLGPDEMRLGVIFITTKAGEHTHRVRAFHRRLARLQRAETRAAAGSKAP